MPERVYFSKYADNFNSNRFTLEDRNKIHEELNSQNLVEGNPRITFLESPINNNYWECLVDFNNKKYFDNDISIVDKFEQNHGVIHRNWWFYYPTVSSHATLVGSITAGLDGVNPYLDKFSLVLNSTNGTWQEYD